jgi:hypothetical protein
MPRITKLAKIAALPDLFRDLRVCLGRTDDGHCKRCGKCLLNAFAIVALTGEWPSWFPESDFDLHDLASMKLTETRRRYGLAILQQAAVNGRDGEWRQALAIRLGVTARRDCVAGSTDLHRAHADETTKALAVT